MQLVPALIPDQVTARYELNHQTRQASNTTGRNVYWENIQYQISCDNGRSSSNAFNLNDAVKFQQETQGLICFSWHSAGLSVSRQADERRTCRCKSWTPHGPGSAALLMLYWARRSRRAGVYSYIQFNLLHNTNKSKIPGVYIRWYAVDLHVWIWGEGGFHLKCLHSTLKP